MLPPKCSPPLAEYLISIASRIAWRVMPGHFHSLPGGYCHDVILNGLPWRDSCHRGGVMTYFERNVPMYSSTIWQWPRRLQAAGVGMTFSLESWLRYQMETLSALLALCAGNSSVTGEYPAWWPVMLSFNVFFGLHLSKRLSKQYRDWWSGTPLRSLRRHYNLTVKYIANS